MNDVIIIGGGPAGSVLGCYLSKAGIKNMIIEGANHPRPHVGESLVPVTTRVFREIDFLDVMEREGFIRKYGASWHAPAGKEASIVFKDFPQEGVNLDYSYHVDRKMFDLHLLKHAEKSGSKVYQGVRVKQVNFENGRAVGVRVSIGGEELDLRSKIVVDASGRNTMLGNQLKIKEKDPIFDQYAVHAWFKGINRGGGDHADFIHIYFLEVERGWVWQIPISNEVTSIGVVTDKKVFRESTGDLEEFFKTHIVSNPDLVTAMHTAERVSEFKTEGDYSYSLSKFVGDGFICIGDAARFVDPIFSSGVSVALFSAKFASEQICQALATGDTSAAALKPYEVRIRNGVSVWYEFIRLYYKLLPLFTYFIQSKEHRSEIQRLLQGDVYDREEVPVLDAMRDYIRTVEQSESHVFRARLSDIPID